MYSLREIEFPEIFKWNEIIHTLPGGTIFHTSRWLQLLKDNQPLTIRNLGVFLDGKLIGVFPLFIKNFMLIKVAGSPFVAEDTPYMGPVIDSNHISNLFPSLDEYLKRNRICFFRTISNQFYRVNKSYGNYHFFKKYTHILNIAQPEDKLWKNLEGRCRTAIRKAIKSGVSVTVATSSGFIEDYYSILQKVYSDQGMMCPNRKNFYYDLWASFVPNNAIFLFAEYDQEIIAGIIMIVDRKRAYYLNGASNHNFRSLSPTNLLLWEAIKLAQEKGVEEFDFVGSDIPRLARFKKSFGGQLVEYSLIEKASSPWIYKLRNRYPYYKQKIGNLSIFLDKIPPLRKFFL